MIGATTKSSQAVPLLQQGVPASILETMLQRMKDAVSLFEDCKFDSGHCSMFYNTVIDNEEICLKES